jgi:hypothetical protein
MISSKYMDFSNQTEEEEPKKSETRNYPQMEKQRERAISQLEH